jgi:hypothetical protein
MALFPIFGAAVALAGGDKLAGDRAYAGMFRHLGWSRGDMRAIAATELAGGLLMVPRATSPWRRPRSSSARFGTATRGWPRRADW